MVGVDVIIASVLWSLALLLTASGVAKLLTRKTDESALNIMAIPAVLNTRVVRTALPWVEILLALALVLSSGIFLWAATAAAVVLFVAFTVFVSIGVRQGDPASCGCFGSLSRAPMSGRTVVRNVVFVALAALTFIVTSTGSYHGPALPVPWWAVVAAAVPLLVVGVIVWTERGPALTTGLRTSRLNAIPPLPEHYAAPGATAGPVAPDIQESSVSAHPDDASGEDDDYVRLPIPYVSAVDNEGQRVSVRTMAQSRARALFYVSPGCGPCLSVLDRLHELSESLGPVALHAVVAHDSSLRELSESLRGNALVDPDRSLASSFGMASNPWAVVLGADGLLAGGPELGSDAVNQLLDELVERFDSASRQ